ncbi:hypothetical protein CPHO_01845 [Corynebacterium phocae]|uniref:Gram-positive pilin subunit D1 N-terminal domain-containing protein n=1 Tax=Corynebacterium phocae TaxID=161895 RepID=A0A1L7D144_9CORY|nr:hypothetical protein CPHO_01845 [Corynebacterium phocae]
MAVAFTASAFLLGGTSAAGFVASPAQAGIVTSTDDGPAASLIDGSRKVNLRVQKYLGDPQKQYGDPSNPNARKSLDPVPGLKFYAQKIGGLDLTRNEGWQMAEEMNIWDFYDSGKEKGRLGEKIEAVTDSNGVAEFSNLEIGLYYITEDTTTAIDHSLSVVNPFVVALPATNAERTGWDYTVTVKPKDQPILGETEGNKQCANIGDTVQLGVTGSLPAPGRDNLISSFAISAPLDESLEFVKNSSDFYVSRKHGSNERTKLEAGDYTIKHVDGNLTQVEFTKSGLEKLSKVRRGNPDAYVHWGFKAKAVKKKSMVKFTAFLTAPHYPAFDLVNRYGVESEEYVVTIPCSTTTPPPGPSGVPPTPKKTPPSTGTTTTPVVPTPGDPGNPGTPDTPKKTPRPPGLAMTGANVLATILFGITLTALGLILVRRNYKRN